MRAYSIDIRERVIENLDQESMRKTAKRFRVSEYFVYRLKQRYKEAGTLAPKPHGGGHGPLVDEGGGEFIRGVLAWWSQTRTVAPSVPRHAVPRHSRVLSSSIAIPTRLLCSFRVS